MQFKQATVVMAILVSFGVAATLPEVFEREAEAYPTELYCCGLGRRGEYSSRCCRASVEVRAVEALNLVERDAEPTELYCCGLGRRGEYSSRCC
ncbi:hypothetical protein V496_10113 [Pseudogymnoascus sp. VKM F-4515 (FW-2607)]|nr:hypothetical protein V496_10113 [Pseudogymnoascus sp. VKM F-4515 (FW-2607)]